MKHGKRPTVEQKKMLTAKGLWCDNWLIVKDTSTETVVVNRINGELRTIKKERKR